MYSRISMDQRGVTLVELMVAMALATLVTTFAFRHFAVQNQQYETQINTTQVRQGVRAAMDLLVREIRMAGYDPTNSGISGIVYHATILKIRSDLDGDGTVTGQDESVDYTYDGSQGAILRTANGSTFALVEDVQGFTYGYRDGTGASVTSGAQEGSIREVDVAITGRTRVPDRTHAANGGYRTYTLENRIVSRNLAL